MLRSLLAWGFTLIYWPLVLAIYFLSFKSLSESWMTGSIRLWGRVLLRILGIRLELANESTLTDRRGRVVMINHQSILDIIWTAAIASPAPLAIGKKELIFVPVINLAWWAFDFVRVDRKNHKKALAALAGVGEKIAREKRSLFVAVEGTRTHDGTIGPFKKGAFHIAQEAQVPIYPVVVDGAYQLLPRTRFIPKKGVIRLFFLPPVSSEEICRASTPEAREALIEKVRAEMIQALQRLRSS